MDKKRVFNAAVTAGLSLSMVLTSVPATALAGDSGVGSNGDGIERSASFSVWASGPDGQSLISGEGFVTFNDPVAFGTLRQMFADFDVPEGKEVVWKTNGATLTDDTVISTDTVIWAELVDVEEPEPEQRYITVHLYDGDEFIRDVVVLNNSSNWSGVLDAPTKDGYTFVGWQQDGASDIMTDLESVVISADDQVSELTFRAVWEKDVDPYEGYITVNYYDGDELLGTGAVLNGTNEWSGMWSGIANPTKDGYVFAGWNFEGDTERLYTDLSTVRYAGATDEAINLYANWNKLEDPYADYINVNYWDGEELLGTGAVKRGTSEWSGPTTPSKDGYNFLGWNFEGETLINPDLSKVVMGADETVTEINLYANWDEVSDPYEGYITVNYYDGDELLGTGAVLNGTNEWSGMELRGRHRAPLQGPLDCSLRWRRDCQGNQPLRQLDQDRGSLRRLHQRQLLGRRGASWYWRREEWHYRVERGR